MIKGEKIYLRLMELSDVSYKVKWINDNEIRQTLNFSYPISVVGTEQWLRNACNNESRRDFIVCDLSNELPVGYAGLLNIDHKNSKAESYLGIGEKSYWRKGIGYEVKKLLLQFGFYELNLNKIYSFHHDDNISMIKINEKLGGVIEGTLREDVLAANGIYKNKVIMSVLRREFSGK